MILTCYKLTWLLTVDFCAPVGVSVYDTEADQVGITYEQMTSIIESVLAESGYYDISPSARQRNLPLAPIGAVDTFLAKHGAV